MRAIQVIAETAAGVAIGVGLCAVAAATFLARQKRQLMAKGRAAGLARTRR